MNDDFMSEFINTDTETNIALASLYRHVLDDEVDENTLGEEVLKLRRSYRKKRTSYFHVSLDPEFRGTEEDIARSLNEQEDYLRDPVNNLISSVGGYLFLKRDYIMCMEDRVDYKDGFPGTPVVITSEEQYKIRSYKEDIVMFNRCIDMIEQMKSEITQLKGQLNGNR